jgi:predicted nuclease of restriction endonuclease-like RecB superfamily
MYPIEKNKVELYLLRLFPEQKKKQQTTTISYYLSTKKSFSLNYKMNCQMLQEERKILITDKRKRIFIGDFFMWSRSGNHKFYIQFSRLLRLQSFRITLVVNT